MAEHGGTQVVWWALLLGGLLGGVARLLLEGRLVWPSLTRLEATAETIWRPGFVADLVLGPIAAFVVAGAGAGTFDLQTAFDARGFWGPFIGSIPAGIGASYMLAAAEQARLERLERDLFAAAEEIHALLEECDAA